MNKILSVQDLTVEFKTSQNINTAVNNLSFSVNQGETFGIVGESGSGKSVTALSILKLLSSNAVVSNGVINYKDKDILGMSSKGIQSLRGNEISMIFQDPMTSLNPVFTIGHQIQDVVLRHSNLSYFQSKKLTLDLLSRVGMSHPEKKFKMYPHEFSGGMRQRVLIAMAIACNPSILIADEPTTALDVSTQSEILNLLKDIQQTSGMTILFITHDLGIIANTCQRMIVMCRGNKVEEGTVESVFANPQHSYTIQLLNSLPSNMNKSSSIRRVGGVYCNG